jgi:hypothetical protein
MLMPVPAERERMPVLVMIGFWGSVSSIARPGLVPVPVEMEYRRLLAVTVPALTLPKLALPWVLISLSPRLSPRSNLTVLVERVVAALKRSVRPSLLVVNSYTSENVDYVLEFLRENGIEGASVSFGHYDERALQSHWQRVKELGACSVTVVKDDMRESQLLSSSFELVINDFRLNFNGSHQENVKMCREMRRVRTTNGVALVSAVVDARYEGSGYGENQEKAPLHTHQPWQFVGSEGLVRLCWPAPYYREMLGRELGELVEFDITGGKRWAQKMKGIERITSPHYRRWVICGNLSSSSHS